MANEWILGTDGYKIPHRKMYPNGTTAIYSNFTARSSRIVGVDEVVFFGLQTFLKRHMMDTAQRTFFSRPKSDVVYDYEKFLDSYLGQTHGLPVDHIAALHDLQYCPLVFSALPEGSLVPIKVPMFTVASTHPDFFWCTNYFETPLSSYVWQPCRNATIALQYRKILERYAELTGGSKEFIDWQGHDFSCRGMPGLGAAARSGAGHLLSFLGTDTIPAIQLLHDDYDGEGLIGGSVAATEHSVMCAGGETGELETFYDLLEKFPLGVLSVVSDTWDLWRVLTVILPALKGLIMSRKGKLVIRPDSGDPVLILTGDASAAPGSPAHKGVIQLLWEVFGGTYNSAGFKQLDSHIGAIYGDSITRDRADQILSRLMEKGFASDNIVFGIGSYTYQYGTRDDFGMAMKATYGIVKGEERFLYKDPITDNGMKRSARGLITVEKVNGAIAMIDGLNQAQWFERDATGSNLLTPVWKDSRFLKRTNLVEMRKQIRMAA